MASIDKIYGTKIEYDCLLTFLELHEEDYVNFTGNKWRAYPKGKGDVMPILNTSTIEDLWLSINCEFKFVINRIKEVYNIREKADKKEVINLMWSNAIDDVKDEMTEHLLMYELSKKEWLKREEMYHNINKNE